jgi:hypothetical protein
MKTLHNLTAVLLSVLVPTQSGIAQQMTQDAEIVIMPNGQTLLQWYAKAGRTYFIQSSDPYDHLNTWVWSSFIESADDEPISHEVGSTGDKAFFRLHYTDAPPPAGVELEDWDADGDGLSNELELSLQGNPLNSDTNGDGIPDGWANAHGLALNANIASEPFQGGSATNLEAYQQGVQANPNATIDDHDGDGVENDLDAVPEDFEINWEKTPEVRYVWIEQVADAADVGDPVAVNKLGQILFNPPHESSPPDHFAKVLWNSASQEWITLASQGSMEVTLDDVSWTVDTHARQMLDLNDDGTIVGNAEQPGFYGTICCSYPGIVWKRSQEPPHAYLAPYYFFTSYPITPLLFEVIEHHPNNSVLADDGSFVAFAQAGIWKIHDTVAGGHGMELLHPADASTSAGGIRAVLDSNRSILAEWSHTAPNLPKIWLQEGSSRSRIGSDAAPTMPMAEVAIGKAPNQLDQGGDRLWLDALRTVHLEKRAGDSGAARWHTPPSMGEGASYLHPDGTAVVRSRYDNQTQSTTPPKLWRNGKYTDLNEVATKPETVTITEAIDLASNGIILAQADDDGVTKTGLLVPVSIGLVEIDQEGNLVGQPTPFIEPNLSAPSFEIDTPQIGTVEYDEEGMKAPLTLAGQVRSDGCDAVRGSMGVIGEVQVKAPGIGGYDNDEVVLNTTVHKAEARTQAGPFAFPFHGDFTLPATPVSLHEGTNVFEIEATDPVSDQNGRITFAFDAIPLMPEHNLPLLSAGGIALAIEIPQDPQTSGEASLAIHIEGAPTAEWLLSESAPDSGVFQNQDQSVAIELVLVEDRPPIALFRHDGWEVEDFVIPLRVVPDGYEGGYGAFTLQVAQGVDPPDFNQILLTEPRQVAESAPGEARAYALRLTGIDGVGDEQLAELTAAWSGETEVEYQFMRDPETNAILIADPVDEDEPLVVLPRFAEENLDPAPDASSHTVRLEELVGGRAEAVQFSTGLVYGFGQGGYDLVVGTGQLLVGAVTYAGDEYTQGLNYFELGFANVFGGPEDKARVRIQIELSQKGLQDRRQMLATIATACIEINAWIKEGRYDLLASLALRPVDSDAADFYSQRLGDKAQLVLDIAADLAESAANTWQNAAPYDKGRYTGILIFEVASSFITVAKVGKLTKADIFLDIANRNVNIPGWGAIKGRAAVFGEQLATTKMCFIAGTLVLVQVNGTEALLPIEELEPLARSGTKLKAWAKCEHTGIEDWRHIVAFFTTLPEDLFELTIDTNNDGQPDETLTGTGEHPFWVEDAAAFVPMRELTPGMQLATARSSDTATVVDNTSKRGPPGERCATYNFEVSGFHTYFVGDAGVWVHNNGKGHCEKVYTLYERYRKNAPTGENPFQTLKRMKERMESAPGLGGVRPNTLPSTIWGRSSADIVQGMLNEYNGNLADFPTYNNWANSVFKSTGILRSHAGVEIHHIVEKYIQSLLGIPTALKNTCPGIPMPRSKKVLDDLNNGYEEVNKLKAIHGGSALDGGLAGTLKQRIPNMNNSMSRQEVVDELFDVLTGNDYWSNQWPVARDWLRKLQVDGDLEASLVIPN